MMQQTTRLATHELAVQGFRAGSAACGIKKDRPDLTIIASDRPATAAAVFTQNGFAAAPVHVCRQNVADGRARAIVVNSGSANACTGRQGLRDALTMVRDTAKHLDIEPDEVLVASTGRIGTHLPMEKVRSGIEAAAGDLRESGLPDASRAILTTDSGPKTFQTEFDGGRIVGIAKGAGMVHPNMATMLSFLVTDASIGPGLLDQSLRTAVDRSFNQISIDGSESTNDMVAILANGDGKPMQAGTPQHDGFQAALNEACRSMARQIAGDGEGATRLLEVQVTGAPDLATARTVSRSIVGDDLVKSAIHGADPNWGRILAAAGKVYHDVDPDRVTLTAKTVHGEATLYENGEPSPAPEPGLLKASEVRLHLDLAAGPDSAEAYGCDLTPEYVEFNSEYTT